MCRSIPAGWPAVTRALALLCALSVSSCSTVQPQIFSEELSPTRPVAAPNYGDGPRPPEPAVSTPSTKPQSVPNLPVEDAIAQAEALQRQYVKAVQDQSGLNAGTSAALITLSALALITGVTHPNGKDLAVMGVVGSGLYAYSSTMTSKPRQLAYLAGVETLNCAVAATRPYVLPADFLPMAESDPIPANSLKGLSTKADKQAQELSSLIEQLTALNVSRVESTDGRKSSCPSPPLAKPPNTDPDRLRAYNDRVALRARTDAACAARPGTSQEVKPSPQIGHMIGQLDGQRKHLHRLVAQAQKQAVVFGNAGNSLRQVTVDTQLSVAREVLKTEPDVASVLSAAQAMRGTAFALSAAPAFKPEAPAPAASAANAAGKAQSSGAEGKSITKLQARVDDPPEALLKEARQKIQSAQETGDELKGKLETLNQRLRLTRIPLERCGQGSPGAVLSLSPDVSELDLAPGASQNFSVSGGAGTPQAKAAAGLTRNLDGSFNFKLPADAEDGSTVTLIFTDGSGKLTREVTIKAVAAREVGSGATVDAGKVPTEVMALALGLKTQPPSAQEVSAALKTCLKDKFKIESPDPEHVPAGTFAKVMNGDCRATP